jgi:ribosomal protein S18 acetylase RimI-like enzyme
LKEQSENVACSDLIRHAAVEDAHELASLYIGTLRDAFGGSMPVDFVDPVDLGGREARLRDAIASGGRMMLVAEASGTIVGCCALAVARDPELTSGFGEITALYVDESHRRHGHAQRLVDAARAELVSHAWHSLVLWVVEANRPARAFYEQAGFAPDGARKVDRRLGFPATLVRYRTAATVG